MKKLWFSFLALLVSGTAALCQSAQSIPPDTVEFSSGNLRLKAYLWKPDGKGPFPAVLFNCGRSFTSQQHTRDLTITAAAQILGPIFAKHGYVVLFPFRRGEGLSADQGTFIGDLLDREAAAHGEEARIHLQYVLTTTDHLQDATAALSFLKNLPLVDPRRIAVVGHSFGGQLTLLMAGGDSSIRAAVAFGPAANSWRRSAEFRDSLLAAVRRTAVPIMIIHPANDYDTTPGKTLAAELDRLHKPNVLKLYPAIGQTPSDGHNFLFYNIPLWESDVLEFLDSHVKS
ncbi:MAG TPA: dienelactone hydrolase family protein [Candidatus Acidoferrum sp.]|nr:dienelactone hydrolase family protein [Candidatus Acidoferrum sp.]